MNLLFVNGLWQQPPDCILPSLIGESPSEAAVPWTRARSLPSVLYPNCLSLLSVPGLCLLNCTSTAISGIILVRKATCIKNNSVNKKPTCNLDQLSDLIYSTTPKSVAEEQECEEAAGGKAGMGDRRSQAVLAAESPFCITTAATVPLLWHRYQREFPCTAWSNSLGKNWHIGELYINHSREWQRDKAVSYW